MQQPKPLTDTRQRQRNIARVTKDGHFLQSIAADEIKDRLTMVNKAFRSVAIITSFPDFWQKAFPQARIVTEGDTLDLVPGAQDLVVHALGLHWANDPVGQLIQCRRALMPDGLFLGASMGGQTLHELRSVLADAEIHDSGGISPRVVPMGEIRELGAVLQRAGLALPVADSICLNVEYRDLWHLMHDLQQMGESNALFDRLRKPTRRELFHRASTSYRRAFPGTDNRIAATYEMILLTGWAPAESQPRPLRPGSATTRLAEVLGSDETPLPD